MRKITEINITKLWGDPDLNIHWKLNPDVNVLAGDNGSGKTTVLDLVAGLLIGAYAHKTGQQADSVEITFDTGEIIAYQKINGKFSFEKLQGEPKDLLKTIDIISTFDQTLIRDFNEVQKQVLSLKDVRTLLDLDLYELQQKYNGYITNIGNLAAEALFDDTDTAAEQKEIVKQRKDKQKLFFDMVDDSFKNTGKTINRKGYILTFTNKQKKEIALNELSSGEKQLLIILLTALVRENQPCILFMDEPELSLHTDWQRTLIDNIRILNEQVQLIIATHAPLLIVNGWAGNVQQMDKIIKPKTTT